MNYFKQFLTALQDIARANLANNNALNAILEKLNSRTNDLWNATYSSSWTLSWYDAIEDKFIEDSRDTWVMIDKKKAVKIVTINWKAEKTESFTRESSLTKEEKTHYKKHGIVLIINYDS